MHRWSRGRGLRCGLRCCLRWDERGEPRRARGTTAGASGDLLQLAHEKCTTGFPLAAVTCRADQSESVIVLQWQSDWRSLALCCLTGPLMVRSTFLASTLAQKAEPAASWQYTPVQPISNSSNTLSTLSST